MVKIKICGLTRSSDIALAQELGADFLGFIFHSASPRYIDPGRLAAVLRQLPSGKSQRVGVFVDESACKIREIREICGLNVIQLHGAESPAFCRKLGLPCWKALRPRNDGDMPMLDCYPEQTVLLDSWNQQMAGGTGREIDPELLITALKKNRRLIIAGGVGQNNLPYLLSLKPYGLDVNSSLEEAPGQKNHERMRAFFRTLLELQPRSEK